jgi:uncharacterized surface protein with fasciclin (FAS1) repeats
MKKKLLSLAVGLLAITAIQAQNLWTIISTSPDHTTLTTALEAAGLNTVLDTDDFVDLTVWAPTDAAFDALPDGLLDALLTEPEGALTDILLYHVTPATIFSSGLADGQSWATLQGAEVNITIDGGSIFVNDAQVVMPFNLDGENGGIVHSINAVLLPPAPCTEFLFASETFLPDAPVKVDGVCNSVSTPFAVWAGDLYTTAGFVEGVEYVASICEGPGAGTWDAEISIFDEEGVLVTTGFGCELTFTVPADGVYLIGISEQGACGELTENNETDNGILTVTCINDPVENTVWNIIENSEDHNTLEDAILAAGLDGVLNDVGTYTVFAPTDAAFDALPDGLLADLLADPEGFLSTILLYHVLGDVVMAAELEDGLFATSLAGQGLSFTVQDGSFFVNDAQITVVDLEADNGVVHVIDAVLVPEDFCTQFVFITSTLLPEAPVAEGGVCETVESPFAVWAGDLYITTGFVAGIEYNFSVCEGEGVGAWDPEIVILNEVDQVIATAVGCEITFTVPEDGTYKIGINEVGACGTASENTEVDNGIPTLTCIAPATNTVVDIIVNSPDHTVLASLVVLADLVEALSAEGPFTVFAPTDEAFAAVDQATLDALTADPSGLLTQVLTYHVVEGAVFSTDLSDGMMVATLNGELLNIGVGATVTVGNANGTATVTVPDLEADNGVVHVINAVLIPITLNVDNIAELDGLNIYPNPANQQFTVDMTLAQQNRVSIDIVNLLGQTVLSRDLGQRSAGLNREYIDISALSRGFYLMNITVGDSQVVSKVEIVK